MNLFEAILLGIIQGLTEFLPVSSSGHIELGKVLLGEEKALSGLDFSILVHVATALSSVIIFRKEIIDLLKGLLEFKQNDSLNYSLKLILSALPVVIVGMLFMDQIDQLFEGRILLVGCMLLLTALILFLTTRSAPKERSVSWKDAIILGLAQTVAVLPGISRSGSTIATGLLLGVEKQKAAQFSFLMVLIPIFGKALLDIKDVIEDPTTWTLSTETTVAGFLAAFLSGLFACTVMLRIVNKGKLYYFSIYCLVVGLIAIVAGLL